MSTLALVTLILAAPRVGVVLGRDEAAVAAVQRAFPDVTWRRHDGPRARLVAIAKTAERDCGAGRDAALEVRYDDALRSFEQAAAGFERALPAIADLEPVARCLVDYGVALLERRRIDAAAAAFRSALLFDPKLKIDDRLYKPDAVQKLRRVATDIEKGRRSSITIVTAPEAAIVRLDGKDAGTAPLTLHDLPAGKHALTVLQPGFEPVSTAVTVATDHVEKVEIFLRAEPEPDLAAIAAAEHADLVVLVTKRDDGFSVRDAHGRAGAGGTVDEALRGLEADGANGSGRVMPTSAPVVVKAPPASAPSMTTSAPRGRSRVHPVLALLPLGIGQFLEKRYVPGALLLVSQVALLATNIACFWALRNDRLADGTYRYEHDRAYPIVIDVAFAVLAADVIAGAIDGLVYR